MAALEAEVKADADAQRARKDVAMQKLRAQQAEQVELRDDGSAASNARSCSENSSAQFSEETALDLDGPLVRGEDAGLVVLELGGGETLGVDQGLFALVIGGYGLEIGLGDLDVVAEDIVKANL